MSASAASPVAQARHAGELSPGEVRRVIFASSLGTVFEWYDFYLYGSLAAIISKQFFSGVNPTAGFIFALLAFAAGFAVRPFGALVFGRLGDLVGRKYTFLITILIMGMSTFVVGILPSYARIGIAAPVILILLRLLQGLALGGEYGGAATYVAEHAPHGKRGIYTSWIQTTATLGLFLSLLVILGCRVWLGPETFEAWGWRIPFLLSVVLVGVGLWVRLKLTETPAFTAALEEAPPAKAPIAELLRRYPLQTIAGTFAVVACFATFYITTAFSLGYGVTRLGYSRQAFLGVQLGAIGFMAAGIVLAGWWSDRTTPRNVLMWGCVATIGGGLLLGPMMEAGSLLSIWAFLSLALVMMGLVYGPLGAFLPGLFPARVRYTGASLAFNIGGIIGGGLTPMVAQALSDRGGLNPVGYYLAAAALVSLVALLAAGRRSRF